MPVNNHFRSPLILAVLTLFVSSCAKKFDIQPDQPGQAPVIARVISNGPLVIYGNYFDSAASVVTVGGPVVQGFNFSRQPDTSAPEILFLQTFTPGSATNNPAAVTVTANNRVSNSYNFLFYPLISGVKPDTALANKSITLTGLFFGNRTSPSTLRAYYVDGNHRKMYMNPDPSVQSWDGTTVQATLPNYDTYKFGAIRINYYLELSVSTDTATRQSLYQ
jgi:hypothetical protein